MPKFFHLFRVFAVVMVSGALLCSCSDRTDPPSHQTAREVSSNPDEGSEAVEPTKISERDRLGDLVAAIKEKHKETIRLGESEQLSQLAKQLLADASGATENDQKRALLEAASEIAFDCADFPTAMDVCEQIGAFDDVTPLQAKTALILRRKDVITDEGEQERLAQTALKLGFEGLAIDRSAEAQDVGGVARTLVESGNRPDLDYQAQFLCEEAAWCGLVYDGFRDHDRRLDASPSDPVASEKMGQFLCLAKNDWETGISLLTRSEDAKWKAVAEQELAAPEEPSVRAQLGDLWWELSSTISEPSLAPRCSHRARHWYLRAIAGSEAEERAALAERVLPRVDSLQQRPVTLRIKAEGVEGSQTIHIQNDGIAMRNGHGTRAVEINHLRFDSLPRRETVYVANSGSTLLFPPAVDFSTADVRFMKRGRWGQMSFFAYPDNFFIRFEHGPGGSCGFELTVEFQTNGFILPNRFSGLWDVAWYEWDPESDTVDTADGWAAIIDRPPTDRVKSDQLNFRCDQEPHSFGRYPPSPKLKELRRRDHYAMVATSEWKLPKGEYQIHTLHDDGLRVFIDDELVLDAWVEAKSPTVADVSLEEGKHNVRVEYYEINKNAYLKLSLHRRPASVLEKTGDIKTPVADSDS